MEGEREGRKGERGVRGGRGERRPVYWSYLGG